MCKRRDTIAVNVLSKAFIGFQKIYAYLKAHPCMRHRVRAAETPAQPYELARTSPPQRSAAEARSAKEPVMTPSHPIIREALGRPGIRNP